jgi:hypothetical protein
MLVQNKTKGFAVFVVAVKVSKPQISGIEIIAA